MTFSLSVNSACNDKLTPASLACRTSLPAWGLISAMHAFQLLIMPGSELLEEGRAETTGWWDAAEPGWAVAKAAEGCVCQAHYRDADRSWAGKDALGLRQ